jgi:hypothetical protein
MQDDPKQYSPPQAENYQPDDDHITQPRTSSGSTHERYDDRQQDGSTYLPRPTPTRADELSRLVKTQQVGDVAPTSHHFSEAQPLEV